MMMMEMKEKEEEGKGEEEREAETIRHHYINEIIKMFNFLIDSLVN